MPLISPLASLRGPRVPIFTRGLINTEPETSFLSGTGKSLAEGLGSIGRFFDVGLGGAFIRNVLIGDGQAALETLPIIGLFTAPESGYAPSGKQLLDEWLGPGDWGQISDILPGLFGEPGSDALIEKNGFWDWTAKGVAGFAAEVLLDPSMYLGIGALTKSGKALKLAETSANARRIILQSGTAEGLSRLTKIERSILPTLLELDGKLPLELLPTFAEQAKAGQRALFAFDVPFTSIATPLVQAPAAFEVFGRAGKYLRGTIFGEAFLKRPGSATGNQTYNDFAKTMVQISEGVKANDVTKVNEALIQMTSTAKVLLHPDERTAEKIASTVHGWVNATEMSDAYKALPKKEQEVTDILRSFMDEFFERDILSGVNLQPLDEFRKESIERLIASLDSVPQDFSKKASKELAKAARASLLRLESANRTVFRKLNLGVRKVETSLISDLEKMDKAIISLEGNIFEPASFGKIRGTIKGLGITADRLNRRHKQLSRQFRVEAQAVRITGRKTSKYSSLEVSLQETGRQFDATVNSMRRMEESLGGRQLETIQNVIAKRRDQIERIRLSQESLKGMKDDIGGLDDLLEAISPNTNEVRNIRNVLRATTASARQAAKRESAYLSQLEEIGAQIAENVLPEDQLALQFAKRVPALRKSFRQSQQTVKDLTEELMNLNKADLKVDDYITHVPTLAAREWMEKNFPDNFRGATYEWRFDHASTLRRTLPGSIAELNEKFRNVLDGADFFTTDPGTILATRALRTSTSETISQFAEGALRMRNVGMDALKSLDDAIREGATFGTTPKEVLAGALEFGADLPKRQVDALDNIRNVLNQSKDIIDKDGLVKKTSFSSAMADLDNIMRRHSDGKLGLPRNKQVLEVWRRKKLTPKVFDAEIADDIDRMMDVLRGEPTVVGRIPRWFQKVTRPWKVSVLLPWPQYHARNFYSEWFLNFLAGMQNPATAGEMAWRSLNVIVADSRRAGLAKAGKAVQSEVWASRLRDMKFQTRDGLIDGMELVDQFRRLGLDEGFRTSELNMLLSPTDQVSQLLTMSKSKGFIRKFAQDIGDTGPGKVVKAVGGGLAKGAFALNAFVERHPRLAQFIWELENNGRSLQGAGLEVVKRHYSYNALSFTKFENQIRATAIPFFSWTRNNVPAMVREFVKFPRRGAVISKLFGRSDFTDEELQAMPKWVRDSVKIRTSRKGVITRIGLPFEDIMEWWSNPGRKAITSLHPAAQAAIEFGTGRRVFTGRPIAQSTLFRGVRLPNAVEILGNAAMGRFAGAGRKLQDLSSGNLRLDEFGLSFFLGPKIQVIDPEDSEFNSLQEQIRALQDEGILKSFQVPFAPKDDERVTPEIRELVKRFRAAAKQRSKRRRNQ